MAVVTLTATKRGVAGVSSGHGLAASLKIVEGTVEVGSSDSANSTYTFFRIPTKARISMLSTIRWDDLASTGSPTLDIGLAAVNSNVTSDPDALNDGLDAAASGTPNAGYVIKDIANAGKKAWEFVNGVTSDPGGDLDVYVSLLDAAVNVGGTISLTLVYSLDD